MNTTKPRDIRFPQVRCTLAQIAELKRRAAKAKQTVSEYVRARCCK